MSLSLLKPEDWEEFTDRFPGVWIWLQQRVMRREREALEAAAARTPEQERRLAELRAWEQFIQREALRP